LGDLQVPAWNYMQNAWVPRGTETAKLLYGASVGWVTHDEMNIFGHTGYSPPISLKPNSC
jgi:alpha-L-fucosidase 2